MDDLLDRIIMIRVIFLGNDSKKDKAIDAFTQLSGLELSAVRSSVKRAIERQVCKINAMLRAYSIKTFEDYDRISEEDLDLLLSFFSKLCADVERRRRKRRE